MAMTIGGRSVATFAVGGTMQAVNQSTWQTVAGTVMSVIGAPAGVTPGMNFNAFLDVISDGTNNYVRIVYDDVQINNGTSVVTVASALAAAIVAEPAYTNIKSALSGFSSLASGGISFSSVSFEPWGTGYVPGP